MTKPLAHSYSALKQYENCPKQYYMQRITREVKPSFGEASIYGNRIHEQLEARLKGEAELPAESVKYEALIQAFASLPGELVAEQEFTLNKDLEATGWWDADAWLRLKLDILIINGQDAVVGDWKTGKYRPDWFQLELFAIVVMKLYPEVQNVKCSLIWLKDMRMDTEVYTRDDAPGIWANFMSKVQRVEQSLAKEQWLAKPSGLCPWCPATRAHCEFAK
jgi:hypothetical protein